ncbi:MAG TPA: ribonuclease R [Candidatus Faecisoma merdavium]|nr:ribonuclease R [Candidatus Faecisoma merdavium]
MEEKIIELLKNSDKALSVTEINDGLGFNSVDELKQLLKVLNQMEDSLKIYRTKKNNYLLFTNSHLKLGTMIANKKGYGFVDIDGDDDVFVAPTNMNGAIHGDRVVVEITSPKGIDLEGRIVKIVDRKFKQMVGEVYFNKNVPYVDLDDERVKITIKLDKTMGAMPGHKVLVKITNKLKDNNYKGEVIKILGHKNDPGVDILSITNEMGIPDTFSDEVMKEVDNLPDEVLEKDLIGRTDLRDEMIFTIDGDDTKDIDDAISIEKIGDNYKLGVHIADVSYYVRPNTALDSEAFDRGTSVYLADRVIPMLPHKLSNGICSLNPNVDRLALSCIMQIDKNGNVVDYDILQTVIRSRKQMTYKNVNKILEENIVPEGYEEYEDKLRLMLELAHILRKNKENRGYIDFDIDESKIIVDDKGKAIDVTLRYRGEGEKLIEDFMIAANETVATHIYYMELPFIYRIHGEPNEEKINNFMRFLNILGYKVKEDLHKLTPKTMQNILGQLKDKKEFHLLSALLLRSMQKAIYDTNNIGHFGIASKCYTHFTSPIRRYPDTTVHRLLHTYIFDNNINNETINFYERELPFVAEHTSGMERRSIECERAVDDMKKAEYMMDHIGEEYEGIISSVMPFGMFVELPNLIEGLVRLDSIKGDYYTYDETTFTVRGNKDKRGFRLGDSVKVRVVAADKEKRTIDFEVVRDGDTKQES